MGPYGDERELMAEESPTTEPTPTDLRGLAAEVELLMEHAQALGARLRASDDDAVRALGGAVGEDLEHLREYRAALEKATDRLVRLRSARDPKLCGMPRGVCPDHGATLRTRHGQSRCQIGTCGREWSYDRAGAPCTEPVCSIVVDITGAERPMCIGHVMDVSERVIGATVKPLPD